MVQRIYTNTMNKRYIQQRYLIKQGFLVSKRLFRNGVFGIQTEQINIRPQRYEVD